MKIIGELVMAEQNYDTRERAKKWDRLSDLYWNKLVRNHLDPKQFDVLGGRLETVIYNLKRYDENKATIMGNMLANIYRNKVRSYAAAIANNPNEESIKVYEDAIKRGIKFLDGRAEFFAETGALKELYGFSKEMGKKKGLRKARNLPSSNSSNSNISFRSHFSRLADMLF